MLDCISLDQRTHARTHILFVLLQEARKLLEAKLAKDFHEFRSGTHLPFGGVLCAVRLPVGAVLCTVRLPVGACVVRCRG